MDNSKFARYFLVAVSLIFFYLAILVVNILFTNIILGLVLALAFTPVYKWLAKRLKSKNLSATLVLIGLLLIIILPGSYIVNSLLRQTSSAFGILSSVDVDSLTFLPESLRGNLDVYIDEILVNVSNFIIENTPDLIGSIAGIMVGMFIMFFVFFYAIRDGSDWVTGLKKILPMRQDFCSALFKDGENMIDAVIYGYLLTAIIQGTLGGLAFFFLGIPNPILWGFIMTILASIPFLGTPIVFVPAALFQLFGGQYFKGIFLLAFGFLFLINIDNFLRPKLIGSKSKVHPVIILIGIFGGLSVFGFVGILLGPLVLSLLILLTKFVLLEFKN